MASDSTLTNLTGLSSVASGDKLYIVDVSDTTDSSAGTSKHITQANLLGTTLSSLGTSLTATATELNYSSGVTSAIQTQLNTKQATITGGASTIATSDLTGSRALVSNVSGKVAVATTTSTEIGYVNGVTSAIQTQLDAKQLRSTLTTKGDLYAATASNTVTRLGIGSNNQVLTADSAQSTGMKWATPVPGDSRRTITLDWSNAVLPDTNFAAISKTVGTNWVYKTLDFDQTTSESVYWYFRIPSDLSTITSAAAKIDWTASAGSGTFIASIVTRSPSDDEIIDATTTPSSASAVTATDTLTATGDLDQFSVSLTTTGWAAGDFIQLKFSRDIADTLSGDAKVLAVTIELR